MDTDTPTSVVPVGICLGCGTECSRGYRWHKPCLDTYRRTENYRADTLRRDGYACASCFGWWNRLVLRDADLRPPAPGAGRLRFAPWAVRKVQADHITALAAGGTHDPRNLQVLCLRHHKGKTRIDLAKLRGKVPATSAAATSAWALLIGLLYLAWLTGAADAFASSDVGAARSALPWGIAAAVIGLALYGWSRYRARVVARLHASLAEVTGDSLKAKRPIRVHRWGLVERRLVPVDFTVRYPWTFSDGDPAAQERLERRVRAKLGWTSLASSWQTAADRVRLRTPDPFVAAEPIVCPWLAGAEARDVWEPIGVGVDPKGAEQTISLVERNLLVGGEPGGGKSNAMNLLLSAAALDPEVELFLVDGKRVEFRRWARCSERPIVRTQDELIALLTELQAVMEHRYDILESEGRVKIERGDGLGIIVLAIDELATYTAGGDKKKREQIVELLRDIVQRGRAAGVIAVLATQRPAHDVVPTSIRDIVGMKWAFRCTTPTASDMIMGQGWAAEGFGAHRIDPAARGAAILLGEGGRPRLMRTYFAPDAALDAVARVAEARRTRTPAAGPQEAPQGA